MARFELCFNTSYDSARIDRGQDPGCWQDGRRRRC